MVRCVALATTGLTALCALLLLPQAASVPFVAVEWLPGAGAMGITSAPSGLYAALATTAAAFLTLLGAGPSDAKFAPLLGAVTLTALGAANVAFLADHFLARYVALEIAALCVALAPAIEARDRAGTRLTWSTYLLLRVGDAGLLAAILVLNAAGGTLHIDSALAAATALQGARLGWAVVGFVSAIWVKLGGWPFHLWSQAGTKLSRLSHVWLYACLMPNLGIYLLYRVTPLLGLSESLRVATLWIGAGGAALAALIALTQPNSRSAMVYVGAAQGGLALFVAAAGVKSAVWLGLLAWTPVRLLLFLAADVARRAGPRADSRAWHGVGTAFFGLGGLALTAYNLLITWWARGFPGQGAGTPLDTVFVAEAAVALMGVWVARAAWQLALGRDSGVEQVGTGELPGHVGAGALVATGLLGGGVLAGTLAFGPLVRHLTAAGLLTLPLLPDAVAFLRYVATTPALLIVIVLALAAWRLQRRSGWEIPVVAGTAEDRYDLAEGLTRAAQALRAVVEVGIAEQMVAVIVRSVVEGARAAWAVEHRGLEGLVGRVVQAVGGGALVVHRAVEQEGLEGMLRYGVRGVLALGRWLQRRHTGRLRRNLLWVPVALALAVLVVAGGW